MSQAEILMARRMHPEESETGRIARTLSRSVPGSQAGSTEGRFWVQRALAGLRRVEIQQHHAREVLLKTKMEL